MKFSYSNLDDLTPQEQEERIIELLAIACVRLILEEQEKRKSLSEKLPSISDST